MKYHEIIIKSLKNVYRSNNSGDKSNSVNVRIFLKKNWDLHAIFEGCNITTLDDIFNNAHPIYYQKCALIFLFNTIK